MPPAIDVAPALYLGILLLLALAVGMPFTGGRAARRRDAWSRFDALVRIRGIGALDRDTLAAWARLALPDTPFNVLVRRADFDRFARAEAARLRGLAPAAYGWHIERLGHLRALLGFDRALGREAVSTHDLAPGEMLGLRLDVDPTERISLFVRGVDEEGVHVEPVGPARGPLRLGPGWASFSREGQGTYRFRTAPLRAGVVDHGTFLILEERRRDPRVPLDTPPFWVAVERLPDGAAPEDPEGVEVEVLDLSMGGVALLADRAVRRGSILGVDLRLGRGDGAPALSGLSARVLSHGFREGGGRRPHFLHCAFEGIGDAQRGVLEAYVWSRARRATSGPSRRATTSSAARQGVVGS